MTALRRAVSAEFAKLSVRSAMVNTLIPLALIIPILINVGLAAAARMNKYNGQGGMDTNNSGYWIMVFSTFILMAGVVTSYCGEFKDKTAEIQFAVQPRRWMLPVAKAVAFGVIAMAVAFTTTLVVMVVIPRVFPDVWERVDAFSADGLRVLIGVPVLTLLICLLGQGIAMIIPRPGVAILMIVLWKWGAEFLIPLIPGGVGTQAMRFSPFRNAEYGAGQFATTDSPFGGPNGSMAYFAAIVLVVFGIGLWRLQQRDVATD
ncbi:ABC transporter permease [Gordonia crocea]|uniref:ABC transporter permease n=1 Tax=Gordonia crocea TaxID=589162 RepID=A0A7I9UXN1_9ACTN|nr:ABC transporter permease [Gordonia crocea]GED97679.1 hypothetical protein nbrc107697_17180 [Gordonia crocea]